MWMSSCRSGSAETVSPAAKNTGSVGLSWRFPGLRICACPHQELTGSFERPAAENAGYRGSMDERVEFTYTLLRLESYRVGKRAITSVGNL